MCGGYVSKGRVCHMWGCEYVLPMMDCWGVFLPYGVRCECWRAYILGACLQVLAIMCVPCLFLFSIVSKVGVCVYV